MYSSLSDANIFNIFSGGSLLPGHTVPLSKGLHDQVGKGVQNVGLSRYVQMWELYDTLYMIRAVTFSFTPLL